MKKKMWIARDLLGHPYLYKHEPIKYGAIWIDKGTSPVGHMDESFLEAFNIGPLSFSDEKATEIEITVEVKIR